MAPLNYSGQNETVIPTDAVIQKLTTNIPRHWMPAFAGMTKFRGVFRGLK